MVFTLLAAAIASASAVIVSIPVIEISERAIAAIWVGDQKCRLRAVLTQSANQFRSLSFLVSSNERILCALACLEFQSIVLGSQVSDLLILAVGFHLVQFRNYTVGVIVLVLNDVASQSRHIVAEVFDCSASITRLGSQIVVYAVNRSLGCATCGSDLRSEVTAA